MKYSELPKEIKLQDDVNTLLDVNEELRQRIDKAIEYIYNHQLVFELSSKEQIQKWFNEFYAELLKILGGENDENNE